jgi:hypothetical protein
MGFLTRRRHFLPIVTIFITTVLAFVPGYAPILYSDDWSQIVRDYIFNKMVYFSWNNRRPLDWLGFKLELDLLGLDIKALYIFQGLFIFLCAVVVYFIARHLFYKNPFLAVPAALIFIVYPVDYTRMWLIQGYTWMIYFVTLLALYLLIEFAKNGSVWKLIAALVLILIPLGAYEAQLGLIVSASLLLSLFYPSIRRKRRFALLSPILVGVIFAIWRVVLQPLVLNIHDPYVSSMQLSPLLIIRRLLQAFPVFIESWVAPFGTILGISSVKMLLILASCAVCGFTLYFVSFREIEETSLRRFDWQEKRKELPPLFSILAVGIILLLAGCIPGIIVQQPNLDGIISRFNLFAILGGSLALVAGIGLLALLLARFREHISVLTIALILPLVLIGITQQVWNQNEARIAWTDQKHFWHGLFATLPNIKNDTVVIAVGKNGPFPARPPFKRLPLTASWELTAGLQVLYDNPSLKGMIYYPYGYYGILKFEPNGIRDGELHLIPYQKTIFVFYSPQDPNVRLMNDLSTDLGLPFKPQGYRPEDNIQPDPPQTTPYRFLVR